MSRRKLWITLSAIAVVVIALIVTLIVVFAKPPATAEDYEKAATNAQSVATQYKAFNDAAQALVTSAGTQNDAATVAQLTTTMNTTLDDLNQTRAELEKSPAVKQGATEAEFKAYNVKAERFEVLAGKYRVSIPLYVTMRDTCGKIGKVDASNILQEVQDLADSLTDTSKEGALARFDAKTGDCIAAATKLNDSGDDSFAKLGGVFATMLTDLRSATETHFNEASSLGDDKAFVNYQAAMKKVETNTAASLKDVSEQQKTEGDESDYKAEIEALVTVLKPSK